MPRYIDADKFLETLGKVLYDVVDRDYKTSWYTYESIERLIHKEQTIEAEPVRHGHWMNANFGRYYICSVCTRIYETYKFDYCPSCGAKMDGPMEVKDDGE